jgi:dTDP-4-dehydrorhamnose 3,5-epimerase-like enzyme
MLKTVVDIALTDLPRHTREDGSLVPLELGRNLPFAVSRIFFVLAVDGAVRGRHAHRQCSQLFLCPNGTIDVECDDGERKIHFRLEKPNQALLVPPGIWASETYRGGNSILTVLCDRPYEEDDYLRDYGQFRDWRKDNR